MCAFTFLDYMLTPFNIVSSHYQSLYDKILPPGCSQLDVYKFVEPSIRQVFKGYNCTVFAYGQTGSGKTHTMFGKSKYKIMP